MFKAGLGRVGLKMDLRSRLRAATQAEHQGLEDALDLLRPPPDKKRFVKALAGFWGFHVIWERSLRRHPALEKFIEGRSKLNYLREDLIALGLTQDVIDNLPLCHEAASLTTSFERAIGSLYVIEGSTLGGQVITRSLKDVDWIPSGGLRYFVPYGTATGSMWSSFQDMLLNVSSPWADPFIEAGALDTFRLLRRWLSVAETA